MVSQLDLAQRDLLSLLDFTPAEVREIIETAVQLRANPHRYQSALAGKTLFMYFEKPSLRTRVTFETGMTQLGGHAIYYTASDGKIGERESVADVARNLERWVDGAMCRTFSHEMLQELADVASIPVINGLTDFLHPCQALADYQTLAQVKGGVAGLPGRRLVYIGDGNNVAHSLMAGGAKLGVHVTVICPPGNEPDADQLAACQKAGEETGAKIDVQNDMEAVAGADAVYTDVWASMGQEDEAAARDRVFRPYQVNQAVMDKAGEESIFMHCLPAHRGDEVTDEVADSPRSVIFQEAENRLHAQKAVMLLTMAG
ncbi:ornithine carbamoyltransferase [Acidobacteria bacterium Mor1]|nr:ornithine carbamoyltransferase [Acidobacteria bacterium Mor1]